MFEILNLWTLFFANSPDQVLLGCEEVFWNEKLLQNMKIAFFCRENWFQPFLKCCNQRTAPRWRRRYQAFFSIVQNYFMCAEKFNIKVTYMHLISSKINTQFSIFPPFKKLHSLFIFGRGIYSLSKQRMIIECQTKFGFGIICFSSLSFQLLRLLRMVKTY